MGWEITTARIKAILVQNASRVVPCRSCVILCRIPRRQRGFTEHEGHFKGRTGTAIARAAESSDTMNTVMLRATKESQNDNGFSDILAAASSSGRGPDVVGTFLSGVCSGLPRHVILLGRFDPRKILPVIEGIKFPGAQVTSLTYSTAYLVCGDCRAIKGDLCFIIAYIAARYISRVGLRHIRSMTRTGMEAHILSTTLRYGY